MIYILFSIVVLILTYLGLVEFLPNYLWFESFGYGHVFNRTLGYQLLIFIMTLVPVFASFFANQAALSRALAAAEKQHSEPLPHPIILKIKQLIQLFFGSYESAKLNITSSLKLIGYLIFSVLVAKVFTTYWSDIVLSFHALPFLLRDPIFDQDISFYIFKLPVLNYVISIAKFVCFSALLISLWTYLKRGYFTLFFAPSFRLIRLHTFILLSLYFSLQAAASFLSKYQLLFKHNDIIYGAGYTDIHFYLSAITVFPFLWAFLAGLCVFFIFKPKVQVLIGGALLLFIPHVLFLSVIPSLVQNYIVAPNEFKKEVPFIQHNIMYTQKAYQLDQMVDIDVDYQKMPTSLNSDAFNSTLNNVRLWNPGPLKSTLKQLQEIRLYYEFKSIDIDRYMINNAPQQVMLSVRELDINQISQQAQTWVNKHLMFTHGYGLCMVPVNQFNDEGLPELLIRDIPPISQTSISITQPEIYFGESTNHYVIANSKQKEFDYPKDNENRYTHYSGSGGIQLDSFFKRLLYAIKLKDIKLLISQNIHSRSRLMYDRNVHVIPQKITPFIAYDNDPYIVINDDGQLLWFIDGYTMSDYFPYSTPYSRRINYIRNSVLATINAYTGKTTFYIKDSSDPIIRAYAAMYPDLFQSFDAMPSDLQAHIRVPKELFKITSKVYNTYHMNDPQVFYNKEDVWTFPTETYDSDTGITMDPYYMYVQHPISGNFEYVMMMPLTPSNKNNLVAILTASCDPNNFGELMVYKLPKQETVYGPLQIESRIDQNTEISKDLTLWGQVGSRVIRGNLMVIPYQNSILYVEPIYLQATQSKLPELKRVIVAFGDKVTMAPSIVDGISNLTDGISIKPPSDRTPIQVEKSPKELTKKIIDAYSKVKDTLKQSDWVSFGRAFDRLDGLIDRLKKEQ